ncbi:MAG: sulfatase-like hydrolase/transferase [Armatimonadota bacterium]|nr:sulfatase-like hydrolase/transferase [Armatimonadota bacterium]
MAWRLARTASLANVLWLPVWERVLYSRAWGVRSSEAPVASLVGVIALALLLWTLEAVLGRLGRRGEVVWTLLVALALLAPLNVVRRAALPLDMGGGPWPWEAKALVLAGAGALAVWAVVRHTERVHRVLGGVLVACLPFAAVTVGQALVLALPAPAQHPNGVVVPSPADLRRTVVLLFDELDHDLAFDRRSPDVNLEEFDRLAARSFRATQMRAAAGRTLEAVPAMLTGRAVEAAFLDSRNRLWVRWRGEEEFHDVAAARTVFLNGSRAGARVAVVGTWLPYCDLVPPGSRCWQVPALNDGGAGWDGPRPEDRTRLSEAVGRQFLYALRALPVFGQVVREDPQAWYLRLLDAARQAVTDPASELVWIHLPLPHPPWIFDRAQQRITYSAGGYDDNLVLADRTLGAVRQAMERAGLWEDSAVVVTSDHWYREREAADLRVPLLVRFPDEAGWQHSAPADATVLHGVVLAVLDGRVRSAQDLARWIASTDS